MQCNLHGRRPRDTGRSCPGAGGVGLNLLSRVLDAGGRGRFHVSTIELQVAEQLLLLPRVGLVLQALGRPAHDPVQDRRLLIVADSWTEACSLLGLVGFSSSALYQSRLRVSPTLVRSSPCTEHLRSRALW